MENLGHTIKKISIYTLASICPWLLNGVASEADEGRGALSLPWK